MREKVLSLTTGEQIHIFDGVFDPQKVYFLHKFVSMSHFQFKSTSTSLQEHSAYITPSSTFSAEDVENMDFFDNDNMRYVISRMKSKILNRCWANAILEGSKYFWHVDAMEPHDMGSQTLLYYANSNWDLDWQGETLFMNANGECEIAVSAEPGRLVLFDAKLMHKPVPISTIAPTPRYSVVFQFLNDEKLEKIHGKLKEL